jgi:hypothetical protein
MALQQIQQLASQLGMSRAQPALAGGTQFFTKTCFSALIKAVQALQTSVESLQASVSNAKFAKCAVF